MNIITSLIFHIQPGLTLLFVLIQLGQDLSYHELILMLSLLEGYYIVILFLDLVLQPLFLLLQYGSHSFFHGCQASSRG